MVSKDYKDVFKMMSEQDKRLWKFLGKMFAEYGDVLTLRNLNRIQDLYYNELARIYIKNQSKFHSALKQLNFYQGIKIIKTNQKVGKVKKEQGFDEILEIIQKKEKLPKHERIFDSMSQKDKDTLMELAALFEQYAGKIILEDLKSPTIKEYKRLIKKTDLLYLTSRYGSIKFVKAPGFDEVIELIKEEEND